MSPPLEGSPPPEQAAPHKAGPQDGAVLTFAGTLRGVRQTGAFLVSVLPFGLGYGAAAAQAGLSLTETALTSGLVFAGAAQFVVLGMWTAPLPVLAILAATFAVNARLIMLGATLRPWLGSLPKWQSYATMTLLTDANWAVAMRGHAAGDRDMGLLLGSGITLWVLWLASSVAGYALGGGIDGKAWGLDVLIYGLFAVMVIGLWRGRSDAPPLAVAAAVALAVAETVPGHWYILAGGLAGGVVGALQRDD